MLGSKQSKYIASENGGSVGLSSILEADVKSIVSMARDTYEKYVTFYLFFFVVAFLWIESRKLSLNVLQFI